jgi:pSer/pThr/pTyr-binding forkhead associated (FHA) protein
LVIRDGTVSRRHAELFVADGSATILDLDSFNGTFVNEARVHSAELQSGDKVQFGSVAFRFTAARTEKCDDDSESATDRPTNSVRVAENNLRKLSPAQRRVVKLLLKGHPEKHVASLLHLSITTVHNHIQAAYRILDVHSRSELLILLLEK